MSGDTIKVFVGCDPNNCDLEQMMVLDYSIHKHTQQPVDIVWMQLSHDAEPPGCPVCGQCRTVSWRYPLMK